MTVELFLGDCLEYMRGMGDGRIVTITDPPYGMKKADWDMEIVPVDSWLPAVRKMGTVAVFTGVQGERDYPRPDWTMAWLRPGSTQRNGRLRGFNNWEPIPLYGIERLENDVINTPNYPDKEAEGHPTPKPLKLMRKLIARITQDGDTVFDPFMGSGTTGVAAVQLGRNFIGCEINPQYFEIAKKRIEAAQMQMVMPLC